MSKMILAFAPHPDDAEIFCGATIAKFSNLGYRTGIIDLTRGELSSQGDLKTRAKEVELASNVLGLSVRENLEIADGQVGINLLDDTKKVVECIRKLKPDAVLIPYWKSRHPDHLSASSLLERGIFSSSVKKMFPELGASHTPKAVIFYEMRVSFKPSFICDVSETHAKKIKAIECYASQVKRDAGDSKTLVSSPLSLTSISARDAMRGASIGVSFGEAFLTRAEISIDDPVDHFCTKQTEPSLFLKQ